MANAAIPDANERHSYQPSATRWVLGHEAVLSAEGAIHASSIWNVF
jgi:hypothetical protein